MKNWYYKNKNNYMLFLIRGESYIDSRTQCVITTLAGGRVIANDALKMRKVLGFQSSWIAIYYEIHFPVLPHTAYLCKWSISCNNNRQVIKEYFCTLFSHFWPNDMNSLPQSWQILIFLSSLSLWKRHYFQRVLIWLHILG